MVGYFFGINRRMYLDGKLNEDGTEISDGKFSLILGKGTFTGKKSN